MNIEQLWGLCGEQATKEWQGLTGAPEPTWLTLLYVIHINHEDMVEEYMEKWGRRDRNSVMLWYEYRMEQARGRKKAIAAIKRDLGIVEDEVAEIALDDALLDDEVVTAVVKAAREERERVSSMVR